MGIPEEHVVEKLTNGKTVENCRWRETWDRLKGLQEGEAKWILTTLLQHIIMKFQSTKDKKNILKDVGGGKSNTSHLQTTKLKQRTHF